MIDTNRAIHDNHKQEFYLFVAALAILTAKAFASPPLLVNFAISAQGWIEISFFANFTSSGQLKVDKFPNDIVFLTALSTSGLEYPQNICPNSH